MNAETSPNASQKVGEMQTARSESENNTPSPPTSAAAMSASQALAQAEELYTSARSGDQGPGEAFQNASKAWELLNQHPDHAECQAMAAEISKSLGAMATKANQKYHTELSGDPVLIEK
ncbi:hypothetical protein [Bremerella sp. P1]|uniref:hypothetical protein n=1 Tax=Bremerella sp. P1 TaxID=3026424 RepID=UPI00236776DE|nr:hypothetical protein [Bremerella sp. P1]WDI43731.1 hypothetical protein PSR63_07195 [Bremerella sp. P1]